MVSLASGSVPSSTPKIRRKNIKISIHSISPRSEWRELWQELKSVVDFWIDQGVRIFRVDNPHTKPLPFWEWLIGEVKRDHPEMIFLAEAFTRPKVMYRLAKLGFSQSYTYFAWRNTKPELTRVLHASSPQTEVREYFRPNLWPNTPDILTEYLQFGGRPAFMIAVAFWRRRWAPTTASTARRSSCSKHRPREPGSEEYLDSEKYQIKHWHTGQRRQSEGIHRADQPDSPGEPSAAERLEPALPRDR